MLSKGGISSKRFWGSIIMGMLCICYIYCTIHNTEMVDGTGDFLMIAALLLGLDTIMTPFANKININKNQKKNDEEIDDCA